MSWTITPRFTQWTPALITTALWLDAADASTITQSSSLVSQWNDKSGNGRNATQSTSANRPTYSSTSFNGKPAISGDGINDVLLTATTPMYGQASFYMHCVLERLETGSGALLGNRSYNGSIIRNFEFAFYENSSLYGINASSLLIANGTGQNGNSIRSTAVNSLANGFVGQAATQWNTGQTPTAWINGTSQALVGWTDPVATTAQVWDAIDPGLGIFNSSAAYSNSPAQCRIAEIIIINTSVSTLDRQKLEGYLAHKWGLTANLPANHPYKVNPPAP
jgi:hypothetical protein